MSRWRPDPLSLLLCDDLPAAEAVAELGAQLDARAVPRGARIACVVPAPFVRYVLVPWNAEMQSRKQRQILAEHCFRETYGELAREWVVRVDHARYGCAALACAMGAALLADLERWAVDRGVVLESVQPALMNAFNAIADPLSHESTWIVVPGSGALTLMLVEDGRPLRVALVAGSLERLDALLRREWFALGREDSWSHVRVCAPTPAPAPAPAPAAPPQPVAA